MGRSKDVDAWFARYQNPVKDVVLRIRTIILDADPRMDECIKWQAPTFMYRGNLASFYPKSKNHASLMFHVGAQIPGTHPRLEGSGPTSRVLKIHSTADADVARSELETIVRAWCDWRDTDSTATAAKKPAAKKPAAKKPAAKKPAAKKSAAKRPARKRR